MKMVDNLSLHGKQEIVITKVAIALKLETEILQLEKIHIFAIKVLMVERLFLQKAYIV
jgi:hypothetical protein